MLTTKLPRVLSNSYEYKYNCQVYLTYKREGRRNDTYNYGGEIRPTDLDKIKEYMGEEAFGKINRIHVASCFYKNGEKIPIVMKTRISTVKTTYRIPFKPNTKSYVHMASENVFYLENGKFIKSDEHGERSW